MAVVRAHTGQVKKSVDVVDREYLESFQCGKDSVPSHFHLFVIFHFMRDGSNQAQNQKMKPSPKAKEKETR